MDIMSYAMAKSWVEQNVPVLGSDGKIPLDKIPQGLDNLNVGYFDAASGRFYKGYSYEGEGFYEEIPGAVETLYIDQMGSGKLYIWTEDSGFIEAPGGGSAIATEALNAINDLTNSIGQPGGIAALDDLGKIALGQVQVDWNQIVSNKPNNFLYTNMAASSIESGDSSKYVTPILVKNALESSKQEMLNQVNEKVENKLSEQGVLDEDRIINYITSDTTSSDTIASTEAVYNLYLDAIEAAQGRVQGRVFDTAADAEAWLNRSDETDDGSPNSTLLSVGDILYTRNPEDDTFWWDGAQLLVYDKPLDLSGYATTGYVNEAVRTKAESNEVNIIKNTVDNLHSVAKTGDFRELNNVIIDYNSLINKPSLDNLTASLDYNDLLNVPCKKTGGTEFLKKIGPLESFEPEDVIELDEDLKFVKIYDGVINKQEFINGLPEYSLSTIPDVTYSNVTEENFMPEEEGYLWAFDPNHEDRPILLQVNEQGGLVDAGILEPGLYSLFGEIGGQQSFVNLITFKGENPVIGNAEERYIQLNDNYISSNIARVDQLNGMVTQTTFDEYAAAQATIHEAVTAEQQEQNTNIANLWSNITVVNTNIANTIGLVNSSKNEVLSALTSNIATVNSNIANVNNSLQTNINTVQNRVTSLKTSCDNNYANLSGSYNEIFDSVSNIKNQIEVLDSIQESVNNITNNITSNYLTESEVQDLISNASASIGDSYFSVENISTNIQSDIGSDSKCPSADAVINYVSAVKDDILKQTARTIDTHFYPYPNTNQDFLVAVGADFLGNGNSTTSKYTPGDLIFVQDDKNSLKYITYVWLATNNINKYGDVKRPLCTLVENQLDLSKYVTEADQTKAFNDFKTNISNGSIPGSTIGTFTVKTGDTITTFDGKTNKTIEVAPKDHTHTEFLLSNGTAAAANKLTNKLIIKVNGTTKFDWNGETEKDFDITPASINAVSQDELNTAAEELMEGMKEFIGTLITPAIENLKTRVEALEAKLNAIDKFAISSTAPTNAAENDITFVVPNS